MPRPRSETPSYLKHSNGQGRISWRGADGKRLFKLLPGPFGSEESQEAFRRACAELAASGVVTDFDAPASKEAVAACRMVVGVLRMVATEDVSQLDIDEALDAVLRRCERVLARDGKKPPAPRKPRVKTTREQETEEACRQLDELLAPRSKRKTA